MQRVCRCPLDVKGYEGNPDVLLTAQSRACPFCATKHALSLHGFYERWALFPDPREDRRIRVRRLRCGVAGKTVSLLPDFCLPRRQHGPEILGRFLAAYVLLGLSLLRALRSVRATAAWHAVAEALRDGFQRRALSLRPYLARLCPRAEPVPRQVKPSRIELARLLCPMLAGFADPGLALRHHARELHALFQRRIA